MASIEFWLPRRNAYKPIFSPHHQSPQTAFRPPWSVDRVQPRRKSSRHNHGIYHTEIFTEEQWVGLQVKFDFWAVALWNNLELLKTWKATAIGRSHSFDAFKMELLVDCTVKLPLFSFSFSLQSPQEELCQQHFASEKEYCSNWLPCSEGQPQGYPEKVLSGRIFRETRCCCPGRSVGLRPRRCRRRGWHLQLSLRSPSFEEEPSQTFQCFQGVWEKGLGIKERVKGRWFAQKSCFVFLSLKITLHQIIIRKVLDTNSTCGLSFYCLG